MNPEISVIVCTYNRAELLDKCLASLQAQSLSRGKYQIIVVENSKDQDIFISKKNKFSKYADDFIQSLPPGLSRARNVGFKNAKAPYVVYLDDDAIPSKKWLESMLKAFKAIPDAICIGGKVEPLFLQNAPSWLTIDLMNYLSVVDYGNGTISLNSDRWVVGANIGFHKTFLEEVGGFPEGLGRVGNTVSLLSNDETPLLDEIRRQDKKIVYCGEAAVKHLVDASRLTKDWFRKRVIWQALSDIMKGDKLSDEEAETISSRYQDLVLSGAIIGRSIFGLMSQSTAKEIFPGAFADELGFLYQITRYLAERGSKI